MLVRAEDAEIGERGQTCGRRGRAQVGRESVDEYLPEGLGGWGLSEFSGRFDPDDRRVCRRTQERCDGIGIAVSGLRLRGGRCRSRYRSDGCA